MQIHSETIKQMVSDIENNYLHLPAIQRKFVWRKHQIELLFDSIMKGFPIGNFLLWELKPEVARNYVFYEFIKDYDERSSYNRKKEGPFTRDKVIGVLDGQQRMSSLFVGLLGSHVEKTPYKRRNNNDAYPKTYLYLNMLSLPYKKGANGQIEINERKNFEFRFLTEEQSRISSVQRKIDEIANGRDDHEAVTEYMYWLRVSNVLEWGNPPGINTLLTIINEVENENLRAAMNARSEFIAEGLSGIYDSICRQPAVNYFKIQKEDLEDILSIFVRVNSAGTQLNKTDLLFSTIVAEWSDGRDEIEELQKKINKDNVFSFTIEYLMRCCLVLSDLPVLYKVASFRRENVSKIKNEWKKISEAIVSTKELLAEWGYTGLTLQTQNATIPIAYYIFRGGSLDDNSKKELHNYLVHAIVGEAFGSSQEQVLGALRNELRVEAENGNFVQKMRCFQFDALLANSLLGRVLKVNESDIDQLLEIKKGFKAFTVLKLLYPNLRYGDTVFHQDHIHPHSSFSKEKMREVGIDNDDTIKRWNDNRDKIPNLQMLEGKENISKNDMSFDAWFNNMEAASRNDFVCKNYLPASNKTSYAFSNFDEFFEKRKELLKAELKRIFGITDNAMAQDADYEDTENEMFDETTNQEE